MCVCVWGVWRQVRMKRASRDNPVPTSHFALSVWYIWKRVFGWGPRALAGRHQSCPFDSTAVSCGAWPAPPRCPLHLDSPLLCYSETKLPWNSVTGAARGQHSLMVRALLFCMVVAKKLASISLEVWTSHHPLTVVTASNTGMTPTRFLTTSTNG